MYPSLHQKPTSFGLNGWIIVLLMEKRLHLILGLCVASGRQPIFHMGAKLGYAKTPVKLKSSGIRRLLTKALFQQDVRPVLQDVNKRHEFKTDSWFS